jgi:hypothetical protein
MLAGCASTPKLVNQNDAAVQYAKLGSGGKQVAQTFYDLGAGDSIKRLYWAQRASQQTNGVTEASPVERLQRKYVMLPSPPFQDADGTLHEGSLHAVEVVQFWKAVPRKGGKTLFICK